MWRGRFGVHEFATIELELETEAERGVAPGGRASCWPPLSHFDCYLDGDSKLVLSAGAEGGVRVSVHALVGVDELVNTSTQIHSSTNDTQQAKVQQNNHAWLARWKEAVRCCEEWE
jgi:hypothetical protein